MGALRHLLAAAFHKWVQLIYFQVAQALMGKSHRAYLNLVGYLSPIHKNFNQKKKLSFITAFS